MKAQHFDDTSQVAYEAIRILFGNSHKSFVGALFVAATLLLLSAKYMSTVATIAWVCTFLLVYSSRALIVHFFNKDNQQEKNAKKWLYGYRFASMACGAAWGLVAYFILPINNTELNILLVLAFAGVCSGALINLSLDTTSAVSFTSALWLTASPAFFNQHNTSSATIMLLAVFIIFVGIASKQMAHGLKNSIHLRLNAEAKEKEITYLSQRQSLHLQHTPMGVIEWSESLHITAWNKACVDIFGYTSREAIGQHVSFLMPELANMPAHQIIARLEHENNKLKQLHNKDNATIYCELMNTLLKNDSGEMVGMASLVQDKSEFIATQEKIHRLAYYDVLTNLPNRGLLNDRINQSITSSKRSNSYNMVAFIDLDHFKSINDIKGHVAGDQLLKMVANRLQNNIRAEDTAARLGGDEFVLVLSDIGKTREQAQAYSEKIIKKIAKAINAPVQFDDYQLQCSASIGLCLFNDDSCDAAELLRRADVAMYLSKKQGRNAYQFYDELQLPNYEHQLKLQHDLNHALANKQFEIFLQGQYNRDAETIGAEVLIRWQHPELGQITPADFIPLAEETGAIVPIGAWVMREACDLLKKWQEKQATAHLIISVNVSAVQFNHADFINQMESAIEQSGCDASKLCLELTESVVINNIEESIAKMHQIKVMGVSLAIDDFGTGYSSLSSLKDLPLDELKIDKSFVKDFAKNPLDLIIIKTILQMGKNLNLRIVAEGVETESQMAYLINYGCHNFQGYFFAKPCSVCDFESNLDLHKQGKNLLSESRKTKKTKQESKTRTQLAYKKSAKPDAALPISQIDSSQQERMSM